MEFAVDVDAFACRKGGVEVGGILEFEFGRTHFMLPSSVLSESGSRGRSLMDPLSAKLPRKTTGPLCLCAFVSWCLGISRHKDTEDTKTQLNAKRTAAA